MSWMCGDIVETMRIIKTATGTTTQTQLNLCVICNKNHMHGWIQLTGKRYWAYVRGWYFVGPPFTNDVFCGNVLRGDVPLDVLLEADFTRIDEQSREILMANKPRRKDRFLATW